MRGDENGREQDEGVWERACLGLVAASWAQGVTRPVGVFHAGGESAFTRK